MQASRNESVEIVPRLGATAILQAVLASAELTAFGGVDPPEPDTRPVDFQRVAVDDAGLAGEILSKHGWSPDEDQRRDCGCGYPGHAAAA
jgi:hypothetical protein